jgi:glutathione S-transferase
MKPTRPDRPIRVHRHPISGHCHRVELYLTLLDIPFERVDVDLRAGAHKTPAFLAMNAFGQIPVIEDGDLVLADSAAIMVYLGERYDTEGRFWPHTPEGKAAVQRWLAAAAGPLMFGLAAARRARLLGAKLDYDGAVETGTRLLGVIESELARRPYLVGAAPTVADLSMYAYVARAPEGDVSLEPYPAVRAWLSRIEALPGFIPMMASAPKDPATKN